MQDEARNIPVSYGLADPFSGVSWKEPDPLAYNRSWPYDDKAGDGLIEGAEEKDRYLAPYEVLEEVKKS